MRLRITDNSGTMVQTPINAINADPPVGVTPSGAMLVAVSSGTVSRHATFGSLQLTSAAGVWTPFSATDIWARKAWIKACPAPGNPDNASSIVYRGTQPTAPIELVPTDSHSLPIAEGTDSINLAAFEFQALDATSLLGLLVCYTT